jgi:hypothetical protein
VPLLAGFAFKCLSLLKAQEYALRPSECGGVQKMGSLTPPGKGRERGVAEAMPYVKRPLDRQVHRRRSEAEGTSAVQAEGMER